MELDIRSEDIKKIEKEMVSEFCNHYESSMIRKSPEEIINMFLDWQYQRFHVKKDESTHTYILYDFQEHHAIMIVDENTPGAYQCIYNFCEELNSKTSEEINTTEIDDSDRKSFKDFLESLETMSVK